MTDAVADLERAIREICSFFERTVAPALAPINSSSDVASRTAKGMREAQEVQNRKYLIDSILSALGWNLADPTVMLIEEEVQALPSGGTISAGQSRFIDYHGRECQFSPPQSLLLIEAKRLSASLPNPQTMGFLDLSRAFSETLNKRLLREEAPAGITKQWWEWLDSVIDYSHRVKHAYGHAPKNAVITNGNWYVVFRDCETSLISGPSSTAQILVFRDLDDVLKRARDFRSALSYDVLRNFLPPQHPSEVLRFAANGDRLQCTIAARVECRPMGWRQPLLAVQISVWVKTTSRGWVLFQMDWEDDFIPLRSGIDDLAPILAELKRRRDVLLSELRKYVTLDIVPPEALAKGRSAEPALVGATHVTPEHLMSVTADQHYLLTVGQHVAHITNDSTYDSCPYHAHGSSQRDGVSALHGPILKSSISPPAFFLRARPIIAVTGQCMNSGQQSV